MVLLILLCLMGAGRAQQQHQCGGETECSPPSRHQDSAVLPLGEAFNIFNGYGFLAFSIHVAPISSPVNNNDSSLFQMVTHPVLDSTKFTPDIKRFPNKHSNNTSRMQPNQQQQQSQDRQTRLHLCDNLEDLTASFFHGFTVDGLIKPWKAFTASWKKQFLPKIFGVPAAFFTDDFTFVLIRIEKRSVIGSINGSMVLEPDLLAKLPTNMPEGGGAGRQHQPGQNVNWRPAIDFFLQFGTHLVSNYTAGDSLYQVLVYNASSFVNHVDLRSRLEKFKPANATRAGWAELFTNPPPFHIGKLQLVSGNRTLVALLESRLALSTLPKNLPSSVRLLAAPVLFNHFYRQLQPRAVLGMHLTSIMKALPATHDGRHGLNDILINLLRMWEYNM